MDLDVPKETMTVAVAKDGRRMKVREQGGIAKHPGHAGEAALQAWRAGRRATHFIPVVSISIRFRIGSIQQIGKAGDV